ncbi:MAG TPA: CDP-alcohol phosphatidyltransferase family protein [Caulifigura sp.]|nr:CDP-alcohol phosphatidyltransferase family protein [Caulifigura sp.]
MPNLTADCYSARERAAMERGQRLRERVLAPTLAWLTAVRVRPGAVTAASLVAGLAFGLVSGTSPAWAMGLLAAHVLLDGIDGPLARWQKRASARGSFTDTVCDQLVLAGVVLTLITDGRLEPRTGGGFMFLYTLVVAFAMVRNALGVPYEWLVRPRFVVYAAIPVEVWLRAGVLTPLCIGLSVVLALKAASGFTAIRRCLP